MKILSSKLKPGFTPILLVGIIVILGVVLGVVFGPQVGFNLGSLGQRQAEQESQAASPVADDPDGDGFSSRLEGIIGTDGTRPCATSNPGGAPNPNWPLDLKTGNTSYNKINIEDLATFTAPVRRMGTKPGDQYYDKRWDLDANNKIDVADLAKLSAGPTAYPEMLNYKKALGNGECKEYFFKGTAQGPEVLFMWTPVLTTPGVESFGNLTLERECLGGGTSYPLSGGQAYYEVDNIRPGKYCAWLYKSYVGPASNFFEFNVEGYKLTNTIEGTKVTFNWSPSLRSNSTLYVYTLDSSGECPGQAGGLAGASPILYTGTSSWLWNGAKSGQTYCSFLYPAAGGSGAVSNGLKFTVPSVASSACYVTLTTVGELKAGQPINFKIENAIQNTTYEVNLYDAVNTWKGGGAGNSGSNNFVDITVAGQSPGQYHVEGKRLTGAGAPANCSNPPPFNVVA